MSETNDKYPAPIHAYEGSDSDSDEYVTSGRAFRDVKEKELKSQSQGSQYEARRRALIRSHHQPQFQSEESSASRNPVAQYPSPRQRKATQTSNVKMDGKFPDFGSLAQGELAPKGEAFVSFALVKKYVDMYIGKANSPKVSEAYFNNSKICQRKWDLFYIYRLKHDQNFRPIVIVPTKHFIHFLDVINEDLGTKLTIPVGNKAFSISFTNDRTPRPRYLGRSTTPATASRLVEEVPPTYYRRPNEPETMEPTNADIDAFHAKILLITQAQAAKNKAKGEQKAKSQQRTRKDWGDSIKRVQRYIGLRQNCKSDNIEQNWEEVDSDIILSSTLKFNPEAPAPFPLEKGTIFICVDIEAWEDSHNIITEIGIATLDTRDLAGLAPGKAVASEDGSEGKGCDGPAWRAAIRARHFRIREHQHYRNTKHVRDCPDKFEYGTSEWISLKDAPTTIASCFKYPFSNSKAPALAEGESSEKRNIVLVGHDLGGDIDYMRKVGYNVHNLGGLIDHIDTKYMWQYLTRDIQGRRLTAILADLGLVGWNPHNAGNDAVYTLYCMLGIAFRHLTERNERGAWKEKMLELAEQRVAEAVEKAREAARQREEGWSSDGGGSDGGEGIKPIPTMPKGNFKAAPVTMSSDTTAATNRRNTVNWGSSNFNNTNAETGWGSSKRTGGGWGKPWENEAKHVGDLGKGLGDLTLNQKREGKPSNSPKWPINGSNTKPAPNKSSKSSRGDDWGLNNGEKTYGW